MTQPAKRPWMVDLLRRIEETGGWDGVLDKLADGWTVKKIAAMYGTDRTHLRRAIRQFCDETLVREAVQDGAESIVEDAIEMMGEATPETAHLRQSQMTAALKLAGFLHKEKFGETKGQTNIHLSVGDLHLQAVKQVAAERRIPIDVGYREVPTLPAPTAPETTVDELLG